MRSLTTNPTQHHVIIMSAERERFSHDENFQRTNELQQRLEAMRLMGDISGFARAMGVWQGTTEESFVILYDPIRHPIAAMQLLHIARGYEQDGVLMADADRNALLLPVCDPECGGVLGKLRQAYPGEPLPDGYTVLNGIAYVCK